MLGPAPMEVWPLVSVTNSKDVRVFGNKPRSGTKSGANARVYTCDPRESWSRNSVHVKLASFPCSTGGITGDRTITSECNKTSCLSPRDKSGIAVPSITGTKYTGALSRFSSDFALRDSCSDFSRAKVFSRSEYTCAAISNGTREPNAIQPRYVNSFAAALTDSSEFQLGSINHLVIAWVASVLLAYKIGRRNSRK